MNKMKNNKGFFLAEAIIMIALVTTVMAYVYPNVSKLYDNYILQSKYYDQTEDLYNLRAIYYANKVLIDSETSDNCSGTDEPGAKIFSNGAISSATSFTTIDIPELKVTSDKIFNEIYKESSEINLYLTGYMTELTDDSDPVFNKYLSRLKKTINDPYSYRLIARFKVSDSEYHYASIKIENPNPNRVCNR